MLPDMRGITLAKPSMMRPRIAVVGAGNLARALAASLHAAGYVIDQIVARGTTASLHRARRLAASVGAVAVAAHKAEISAGIVWFCVPDGAIGDAAASLERSTDWNDKVALHSSGALTSNELSLLRKRGAHVAAVHPLMTFVRGSQTSLTDVPFAIEGDTRAVHEARLIVKRLGGYAYSVRPKNKAAYHAWGMFTSPLLISLLATSEHVAAQAGLKKRDARKRMLPILRQTLNNYQKLGAAGALSGPLARGDADTIQRHLRTLRGVDRAVYISLIRSGLVYLPTKNGTVIEKTLRSRDL
jgi:predicted short-subunit dehydrogenase-like oxidoreductase (DUF2520 family)